MMETSGAVNEILCIADVAELLQTCRATIYRLLKTGDLPAFKLGSDWRFRRDAIMQWIEQQEQKPWSHGARGRIAASRDAPDVR